MKRKLVGLMSGTSIDGVDAALIEVDGSDYCVLEFVTTPFTPQERQEILRLCDPSQSTVEDICRWNFILGERFAEAVVQLLAVAGVEPEDVAAIGSHGQTVYHIPGQSTLQIGEPAVIAARTGIVTIGDFRTADIAVGGQGAPLVPYFDQIIFGQDQQTRAIQNIGGIGNVAVVGPGAEKVPALAFDTGPGNMIIDGVVEFVTDGTQTYDQDGQMAQAGKVDNNLLAKLMAHPYLSAKPPKSTGRELFGKQYVQELIEGTSVRGNDLVATVTAFTAHSIVDQYQRFILPYCQLDQVVIGGGGSYNPRLVQGIEELLGIPVKTHDDFGIRSDAKEAIAFALLADATLQRKPSNVRQATGAKYPAILGKVNYPPVRE